VASLLLVRVRTALSLGLGNIARVIGYRLRLRAGIHAAQRIAAGPAPRGPFFGPAGATSSLPAPPPGAWRDAALSFGWHTAPLGGGSPDWHRNSLDGTRAPDPGRPWWAIPDFDPALGDVKAIWEASRFDWAVNAAQRAKAAQGGALEQLNGWLADWCAKNPPYRGHNWKCAQEASIRVMHLALAALVLDQTASPLPALVDLVTAHLRRIAPTVAYAVGQENNHGTSEAAALFIGGSWLERLGRPEGAEWHRRGRALLEERVRRLVMADGTFSQYSASYQRLMLDTLGLAEIWRRRHGLPPFSTALRSRAAAAAEWLRAMVDPATGNAPNLGGNDGADLLPLTDADRRDFRPAVQLAAALFEEASAFAGQGPWRTHLAWLGIESPERVLPPVASRLFDDGGFALLQRGDARALLRYPRFRFRPAHADALHLDLCVAGENLLRDAGSFSYAAAPEWQAYFPGAKGHNTVQFDDREQMPRLGRFLWGGWLKTRSLEPIREAGGATTVAAAYDDDGGAHHARRVELRDGRLLVTDTLGGTFRKAVLRWRLKPGRWTLRGAEVTDGTHRLAVTADVPIVRCELVAGWESRYYLQKTEVPVLEVEVAGLGAVVSEYRWAETP
jgi:hypothetical protein